MSHLKKPGRSNGPRRRAALLLVTVAASLTGCVPVIIGGAALGAAAVYDRRGPSAVMEDQQIEFNAMRALEDEPGLKGRGRISVTSYNYQVLLTGQVRGAAEQELAAGVVRRMSKVRKVINEVTIGPDISLPRKSEDVLVTSRAKLALFNVEVPNFDPTRVKIVTEDGVVYLLGLVSEEEGNAAAEQVRYVPGVKQVVKLFEYRQPRT
ncbi:BON domain-containing protein [uncultured Thiodictyon sp.]|uniref:BON domain-containing protein n=1 Tax=uncultured Thiodictyon sp. TaxID=1846217 RepID=UPI0025FE20BD|nr:BON domain-containing protein [uncultured Thiodictyon sp.]